MFQFEIDAQRRLVTAKFAGLLTPAEAEDYVKRLHEAFVARIGIRSYVMLIDTTEALIQPAEVIATFCAHIANFPRARRIALVNGQSLARMQLKRILERDYARYFDTVEAGMRWLFEDEPALRMPRTPAADNRGLPAS